MKLKNIILTSILSIPLFFSNVSSKDLEYIKKIQSMNYKEVITEIKTPKEAEKYLTEYLSYKRDTEQYGEMNVYKSFKHIHQKGFDDCNGGALAAAALLSDNGYKPLVLTMMEIKSNPFIGHMIFIYQDKNTKKWGTLGIGKRDCKNPIYNSIPEIVNSYNYITYFIKNIEEEYPDYIYNDINMRTKLLDTRNPIKANNKQTLEEKFLNFGD